MSCLGFLALPLFAAVVEACIIHRDDCGDLYENSSLLDHRDPR